MLQVLSSIPKSTFCHHCDDVHACKHVPKIGISEVGIKNTRGEFTVSISRDNDPMWCKLFERCVQNGVCCKSSSSRQ